MKSNVSVLSVTLGLLLVSLVLVNGAGEPKAAAAGGGGKTNSNNGKPAAAPTPAPAATKPTPTPAPVKEQEQKAPVVQQKKTLEKLGPVKASVGVTHDQRQTVWKDLENGQKLPAPLEELDGNYKLSVKVTTTANQALHQVFLILRSRETKEEVGHALVREAEDKGDYKLELDVSSINLRDTKLKSGTYDIVLYLGDFNIEEPLQWTLGEVPLKLVHRVAKPVNQLYAVTYEPKPEIKHMFREPEPRPPMVVSNAFTALVLVPIVLLLGLWAKIGINFGNFPCSLSALLFHVGLIGMFGVYGLFWLKLNMFEAFKWMAIPALITFLSGNRLLSHLAEQRSGK